MPGWVEINYDDCIGETYQAVHLVIEGKPVWVPKAVIDVT